MTIPETEYDVYLLCVLVDKLKTRHHELTEDQWKSVAKAGEDLRYLCEVLRFPILMGAAE